MSKINIDKISEFIGIERKSFNPRYSKEKISKFFHVSGGIICGDNYKIFKDELDVIDRLVSYIARDESFNSFVYTRNKTIKYNCSLNKGILLVGKPSTGKTTLIRQLIYALKYSGIGNARMVSSIDLADEFANSGSISKYKRGLLTIDDIGDEDDVMYYGQRKNTVKELITTRYSSWQTNGLLTFATSNLTADMIGERYGERVLERIYEMMNVIIINRHNKRIY